ncbi:MAG: ABC transporter permease, partial [Chloroflexota bacterium]
MTTYILKRLLAMIPVMLLVSMVVFVVMQLTPGDLAVTMLGEEARPELLQALRHDLGLDQPIPIRYVNWLSQVVRGDFGRILRTNQPVLEAILERLPATVELTLLALLVSLSIAIPTGIISATRRGSRSDLVVTTLALSGVSMPGFVLALLLVLIFSSWLRWLPNIGYTPIQKDLGANLKGMIMPALTLGTAAAAVVARLTRSSLLEVLGQEYIRTARAKGLREQTVIYTHALKNAMIPVVTIIGLQLGALLGGAVITERIFVLPGVGNLIVDAIFQKEFLLVQGAVLFLALIFQFANLLVDVLYAFLDPRIR